MKRVIDIDFETRCKKTETALRRFEKKYSDQADEWKELIEWMLKTGCEHETDENMADGTKQRNRKKVIVYK